VWSPLGYFLFQESYGKSQSKTRVGPATDASGTLHETPEKRVVCLIVNPQSYHRVKRKSNSDLYHESDHKLNEENRKSVERTIRLPEDYVVMPHRTRQRPGFHNSPAQNPPFVPFNFNYAEEIRQRNNSRQMNHPLTVSAPPYSERSGPHSATDMLESSNENSEVSHTN
jgi:hypothetical protein